MASMITSAGSASGMDFESIISASVEAKRAQLENRVTTPKEETNLELSGVGKLKSALEEFQKTLEALTEENGFNTRKVTTDLPTENPYFSVTTKDDAANGTYDIAVTQLASTEKVKATFDEDTKLQAGTIKITLPPKESDDPTASKDERTFEIEVSSDDTLASLRRKINNNDFGVTASIVQTEKGQILTIDSGVSGDKAQFKMEFTADPSATNDPSAIIMDDYFDYDSENPAANSKWTVTSGQDAVITVDGEEVRSSTNEFDDEISGISITVNRLSEKDSSGSGFVTNNVTISADVDAVTTKMQNFVTAYNTLMTTMDGLYKHNTYTDGENNYDGGQLSGDSMLRSLQDQVKNMMTNVQANAAGLDIYSVGIKFDSDGTMSLDTTKFKENINENFNGVVNIFSGDDGILNKLNDNLEEYTKSKGVLDQRTEQLNEEIKRYEAQEAENATYLEEYEASLRQRYANLDTTIANYNSSLTYLQAALG